MIYIFMETHRLDVSALHTCLLTNVTMGLSPFHRTRAGFWTGSIPRFVYPLD